MNQETQNALDLLHRGHKVLLREVGRICKKHGINWFLESGTLLGAVRHKSAIPWDDDADIVMLRADFERFRKVVRSELAPEFYYVEPDELGKAVFDFVPRIGLKDSSIRPENPEDAWYGGGIYNHLLIDIFIVDDVSDSNLVHKFCYGLVVLFYGLGLGHRYSLDYSQYPGASGIAVRILSTIGRLLPAGWIVRMYDRVTRLETGKNRKKGRVYYGNYLFQDIPQIYQKEWFAPAKDVYLDEEAFPGPNNAHMCLKTLYGNYMELPPEDKRTQPHMQPEYVVIHFPQEL